MILSALAIMNIEGRHLISFQCLRFLSFLQFTLDAVFMVSKCCAMPILKRKILNVTDLLNYVNRKAALASTDD
jgi:hypothetical protein